MVRPKKVKIIQYEPETTYFKPQGIPLRFLQNVELNYEELESLRLSNLEKLDQIKSAKIMNVHQSTFQRTLARAREKITDALVNGKSIKIQGGNYKMPNRDGSGPLGKGSRTGRKMGSCKLDDEEQNSSFKRKGLGKGLGRGRNVGNKQLQKEE